MAVAAFFLPPLAYLLLGQSKKAVLGFFFCGLIWPIAAFDVYRLAGKLKQGKAIGEWQFF
jgi:hypothetical protein